MYLENEDLSDIPLLYFSENLRLFRNIICFLLPKTIFFQLSVIENHSAVNQLHSKINLVLLNDKSEDSPLLSINID